MCTAVMFRLDVIRFYPDFRSTFGLVGWSGPEQISIGAPMRHLTSDRHIYCQLPQTDLFRLL